MENLFPSQPFRITVKTMQNLEEVLKDELTALGATNVVVSRRAVFAYADLKSLYRINLNARTALRVLVPIAEFQIRHVDDIYKQGLRIEWSLFLRQDQTFAIDSSVNSDMIRHSHFASLRLKDSIADQFRNKSGKRPDVNPENPDVQFHIHVDQHRVTISIDSSGESLNRRGYRLKGARAPINEVLAAGMIMLTGWQGECDLYDPMCGSGTIAIEAAMIAMRMPAQAMRNSFGFMKWSSFDRDIWQQVRHEASENIINMPHRIYASDADARQLKIARENIEEAGFDHDIQLDLLDFFECKPKSDNGIVIMNPPYGERMDEEDMMLFYKNIGNHLKHHWPGHKAWIISANDEAIKNIGLKTFRKFQLMNGTLPCRYNGFDLFSGSRKIKSPESTTHPENDV